MNQNPASSDWASARGDKWASQLVGMEAMLAPVDEPLVLGMQLTSDRPSRIAEVGCGGGATTRHVLRRAPVGSVVHGFDISSRLVGLARAAEPFDAKTLAFDVADMAVTAPAIPYDRLFSRFGVMFFDDPPSAFANLARWLAPAGRFAFAVWGAPADNEWMDTSREIVGRIIDLPAVDADAPGPFRYGRAEKFLSLLEHAGFSDVRVDTWRGALPIGGRLPPADAATFALASIGAFGDLLAKAGESKVAEARAALTERYGARVVDGGVRLGACVHVVTGKRK